MSRVRILGREKIVEAMLGGLTRALDGGDSEPSQPWRSDLEEQRFDALAAGRLIRETARDQIAAGK